MPRQKKPVLDFGASVDGDEDTWTPDEKLAVESLARIIASGGSEEGVAKAKETYEFVTGDEWAGEEEAARWIAEEYSP